MGGLKLKRLGMIMAPEPGTRMNWKGSSILRPLEPWRTARGWSRREIIRGSGLRTLGSMRWQSNGCGTPWHRTGARIRL
jgi:hypothetical protein